jgi:hypothetical protein
MYPSPDTPYAIKRMQQKIWLSKPIEERIIRSLQMIEDARLLQIHGLKLRYPNWTDDDIRLFRLKRLLKKDVSLQWLAPLIEQAKLEQDPSV